MNPKKIIEIVKDPNRNIYERLFCLINSVALIALLFIAIVGWFLGETLTDIAFLGSGWLVLFFITASAIRTGNIRRGTDLIAVFLILFVLPACFIFGGGIYGGTPLWFIFCVAYIGLMVAGREKYLFLIGAILMAGACYLISYHFPEWITSHSRYMAHVDSFVSFELVSVLLSMLIIFQTKLYLSENKLVQEQKKDIEEINKAQNRFFSSMSHEIRTPINTIIGLNEMIMREAISDEVYEDAKNIESASRILLHLINEILDMSKLDSGRMEVNNSAYQVGEMLSEIVNMVWIRAKEKGIAFHINVDPALPAALYGDEIKIKEILINILTNAIKYTSKGSVTLSIQGETRENGKFYVLYSIADTGIGIRRESIPYLFSAFRRVDEEKNKYIEGTGLGLAISKKFTDLMGGEIKVNSIYTKGSTFIVEIPQEIADATEIGKLDLENRHFETRRVSYKQKFVAQNARVLIVDDNEANLMVETKLLKDTKVQIETASSGEEALEKTLGNKYHVILMDHLMPGMDGITCLHKIRKQAGGLSKDTPIVALTANAGSDMQELYRKEGFVSYLTKPVTGDALERTLFYLLPAELIQEVHSSELLEEKEIRDVLEHQTKKQILITTDSNCDLPAELLEEEDIQVIPYNVHTDRGIFLDGEEIGAKGILSYMERGKVPYAVEPGVSEYESFFAENLLKANRIIHITPAYKTGKGYQYASEASKSFDNVTVVDSGHTSSGMGLIVLAAAGLAREFHSEQSVLQEIEKLKKKVSTSFLIDDTKNMLLSGKISKTVDVIYRSMALRPMIFMWRDNMRPFRAYIGTRNRAWRKYIAYALKEPKRIDKELLFITHVGLSYAELEEVEAEVRKRVAFHRIIYQEATVAIAASCGLGTFGLIFKTLS